MFVKVIECVYKYYVVLDIDELARRIGIDPVTEPHLRYLAEESLRCPTPRNWKIW
jgi:hypothetical protein